MDISRRTFIIESVKITLAASASLWSMPSVAQVSMLGEDELEAKILGYKTDASNVDKSQHILYVSGQQCSNCSWFKGRSGDAVAGCAMYSSDRLVYAKAWCSAWMKHN